MNTSTDRAMGGGFSKRRYFEIPYFLTIKPSYFFSQVGTTYTLRQAIVFLLFATGFNTFGLVTSIPGVSFSLPAVNILNALAMPAIAALIALALIKIIPGKRVEFRRLFTVYAFSFGVALLASWVPSLIIFTEPGKWFLTAVGLNKSCGLSRVETFFVIALSLCVIIPAFWLFINLTSTGT